MLALRFRVGQSAIQSRQSRQLLRCPTHHPNRLSTPFDGDFFAWLDGRYIYLYRGAGGFRALRRLKGTHKRNCGCGSACNSYTAGRNHPGAFAGVVRPSAGEGVAHENPQEKSLCGKPLIVAERKVACPGAVMAFKAVLGPVGTSTAPYAQPQSGWQDLLGLYRRCQKPSRGRGWYAAMAGPK